ncbi:MAG: type I-C CRISPR-associated protein Cas7/Csd2 [Acidobacteria bacterium]|nr:MAG: type I-C CRISPR-associated protein Cas7/Csd2 [Acidobacteriota bacterium]
MNGPIQHRYDFVLLFDVVNGNPNGDPDAGNAPRVDPETGHGLVSDVCLKRKIRNYVTLAKTGDDGTPEPGYDIYVKHHGVLETLHKRAYEAAGLDLKAKDKKTRADNVFKTRAWMCQTFYDVRTFGAVMSTGINCGQVRGPVQLSFSRSQDPIAALEQTITRKAVTTEEEALKQIDKHGQVTGTMGRKEIVPYGLYRAHGFVSPHLAADTGFTQQDLELLWQALEMMFEHDHSATRGEMATRKLVVFEHDSKLGNAPAHRLFERVKVEAVDPGKPPRAYADYRVVVDADDLPPGIRVDVRV